MRFSLTIDFDDIPAEVAVLSRVLQGLGTPQAMPAPLPEPPAPAYEQTPDIMVQPDRTPAPAANDPKPKRGRPKLVQPEPEVVPAVPANGEDVVTPDLNDVELLRIVGLFCKQHPHLHPSITKLLRDDYNTNRISGVVMERRAEFLAAMNALPAGPPEAA